MRVLIATLLAVGLGLNLSACGGDSKDKGPSEGKGAGASDAGEETKQEDGGAGGDSDAATTGGDSGSGSDAAATGGDGGAGNFSFIEGATACDDLPGSLTDTYPGEYKGLCVAVDWANNPCTIMETECPDGLFFDWQDKEGGYFNLKLWQDDVVSSTAGTVNMKATGVAGLPASVTDLPEGEDVMVQVLTDDNVRYNVEFRRNGNVITINYIIKLAI